MPIALTKEAIDNLQKDQVLKVEADDPAAEEDIARWVKRTGHQLIKFEKRDTALIFYIKKTH
jgi:TusA-related sulfurtransferase